ncbi:MAG: nitrogen fixation protein NifX [Geobacteraceae bacterium]|nr:nitrogen fixation protein NifX [Geobacteraceae bacterium]
MRVAFTSSNGEMIDQHFGMSDSFCVWDIGPKEAYFIETVTAQSSGEDVEDKIMTRADVLRGCTIVYSMQIGGPAAAKLVARKIHPMKTVTEVPVEEIVGRIQNVLKGTPPPWLKKAMETASNVDLT